MADDDLLVTISGAALSLLLYENTRIYDQIGFLLGEILIYVTKKVTDSDRDVEHTRHHINVKTVVAYPISEPFFDTIGRIHQDKLKNFLKGNTKKIVGWYHYRQNNPYLKPTLRDRHMHIDMSNFFSKINDLLLRENFIMCLLNSSVSESGGTHKFKHVLLRQPRLNFLPVQMKINNLGADAARPDGSDYKPTPTKSSCESDPFDRIYQKIENDLKRTSGVQSVTLIQKTAEHLLSNIIPLVTESDKRISELEIQLNELRQKKFSEALERAQLSYQMQQMEVDTKPENIPESPESPDMVSPPKSQGSSSSSQNSETKHIKKESSENRVRDNTSSDRDVVMLSPGKEYYTSSRLVDPIKLSKGSSSASSSTSTSNITDRNRTPKPARQTTDQFIQSSASRSSTYSSNKTIRQSPDHEVTDT